MAGPQPAIGHFRITSRLGVGGMGEVWRATDTRLNREVAIKVLPEAFAADPMRMARFAREAQVLASLNHPGIAAIYGVEDKALVMELVEGATLAERIARGPLLLEEALPIAAQMAEALEYAHERGVVHRDLKPANIKVTPQGRVKILDFGLAKAASGEGESSVAAAEAVTLSSPATLAGTVLGTAAYMAPEQARGQAVDRRADIWAFGVVLYEMLTGQRPFEGPTVTDTLAAVLRAEPAWERVPWQVRPLLQRCLEKDTARRLRDAADGLLLIDAGPAAAQPLSRRRVWLSTAAAGVALIAAALLGWWLKPVPPAAAVSRFNVALPDGVAFRRSIRHVLAISPDGSEIVFNAGQHLYLRSLNQLDAHIIAGTADDLYEPVFSPDGQSVAYFTGTAPNVLQRIPISGGAPVTLCQLKGAVLGASWADGHIVFGDWNGASSTIESVPDTGGTPQVLATAPPAEYASQPQLLDHSRRLLFALAPRLAGGDARIVMQDVGSPASLQTIITGGLNPQLLSSGRLLYVSGGTLFGASVSLSRAALTGAPVPLVVGVSSNLTIAQFAVSGNGTLVYVPGLAVVERQAGQLAWVDRLGKETAIAAPPHDFAFPHVSPDGKRVLVATEDSPSDLWVWDTVRSTFSRLTFTGAGAADGSTAGAAYGIHGAWSRDGRAIYYTTGDGKLYRKSADGAGQATAVAVAPGVLDALAPDDSTAVFRAANPNGLALLPLQPPGAVRPLLASPKYTQMNSDISPDGHWLAYQSNEVRTRWEIYVRPYPNVDAGKWQISSGGGSLPRWSRDGHTLYYSAAPVPHPIMAVSVQLHPTFTVGQPRVLLASFPYKVSATARDFDVAPDGRFLVVKLLRAPPVTAAPSFTIVTNWCSEVAARVH